MSSPLWLSQLFAALSKVDEAPAFVFATVDADGDAPIPRARHHLYRNILTSNPARPLIITTTDIRSAKIHQIRSHPNPTTAAEITWWFPASEIQFRSIVRTYILPSPSHELHSQFPTKLLSGSSKTRVSPDNNPGNSAEWEAFRVKTFNSVPGYTRAGFARPTPGSALSNPDDARKWPEVLPAIGEERSEEEKKLVKEALKNFAVLALEPIELDVVELGTKPLRRTKWKFAGGEWRDQPVVP